ncbi:MAG: NAD(P)H-hydrate dehydratase [Candidatus Thermoplasmatota archaeon]|nr:NAD(P)H-hydrate dehydratase [Candidatus Thermoplasmatota archaeon]
MLTGKEIHVLDINSEFYGVPTIKLMENAGKNIADFINKKLKLKQKNIIVFCGTGNNGGDGFVAARYLSEKNNVTVFLSGKTNDIKTDISKKNYEKIKNNKKIEIHDINDTLKIIDLISKNDLIIDAILGIGLSGEIREPYLTIVKIINNSKNKTIISVDVPTGLGTNNYVKADYTITFHDIKKIMNPTNCGDIMIVDIGIPKKAEEYVGPGELKTYYPIPKKESHKGDNGRLLIVGGGPYYGAPALSSFAAERTGLDLVIIATPKKVAKAITSYSPLLIKPVKLAKHLAKISPTLIVKELNDEKNLVLSDIKIIEKQINKVDALLIGPGLGIEKQTQVAIEKIIKKFIEQKKPIVIDADAIRVVGKKQNLIKNTKTVITPHTGEFKHLTGVNLTDDVKKRKEEVQKWAKKLGVTIVLKGPVDVISNGEITKLNDFHNPSMTVGGTGDVLAGIIGALLSKGVEPFNAARMGIFINGAAGNLAFEKYSYGLIATDVIEQIPNVLKKYLSE